MFIAASTHLEARRETHALAHARDPVRRLYSHRACPSALQDDMYRALQPPSIYGESTRETPCVVSLQTSLQPCPIQR